MYDNCALPNEILCLHCGETLHQEQRAAKTVLKCSCGYEVFVSNNVPKQEKRKTPYFFDLDLAGNFATCFDNYQ